MQTMKTASTHTVKTDIREYVHAVGQRARAAARVLARAETAAKNQALLAAASALERGRGALLAANQKDLAGGAERGLDAAMLDRLELRDAGIGAMAEGLRQIAALPDPVGEITGLSYRPSGIQVGRMRVPRREPWREQTPRPRMPRCWRWRR